MARAAARSFSTFWDTYDVLVTPVYGVLPPPIGWAQWDFPVEARPFAALAAIRAQPRAISQLVCEHLRIDVIRHHARRLTAALVARLGKVVSAIKKPSKSLK